MSEALQLTITLDAGGTAGTVSVGPLVFHLRGWRAPSPGLFRAELAPAPTEVYRELALAWLDGLPA